MRLNRFKRVLRRRRVILSTSLLYITLITLLILVLPQPTNGTLFRLLFSKCSSTSQQYERCGLLNMKIKMHSGDANTNQCIEYCVYSSFIHSNLNCGSCTIIDNSNVSLPGYNMYIDLVNITGINNGSYFRKARDRWQNVITGDVRDVSSSIVLHTPSIGCTIPNIIDDIYICARYMTIDGRGSILGSAGPTEIRTDTSLPIVGEMKFDIEDVINLQNKGTFDKVILHEMGHILGIGALWSVTEVTGPRSSNCPYYGTAATTEFRKVSNCKIAIAPTETDYDRNGGTFCSHWDEECMESELMTGFLENNNSSNPLSRITIAGLSDLGYTVDYTTADTFTTNDLNIKCRCNSTKRLRSVLDTSNHGKLFQFGIKSSSTSSSSSSSRRRRRRISDEAHQLAMNYGLGILEERAKIMKLKLSSFVVDRSTINETQDTTTTTPVTKYIGDKIISVLIEEDSEIFGVMVINE